MVSAPQRIILALYGAAGELCCLASPIVNVKLIVSGFVIAV
jgi:hypothetical protein